MTVVPRSAAKEYSRSTYQSVSLRASQGETSRDSIAPASRVPGVRYRQHQRRIAALDDEPVVPVVGLLDRHRSTLLASIHQPRGAGAASCQRERLAGRVLEPGERMRRERRSVRPSPVASWRRRTRSTRAARRSSADRRRAGGGSSRALRVAAPSRSDPASLRPAARSRSHASPGNACISSSAALHDDAAHVRRSRDARRRPRAPRTSDRRRETPRTVRRARRRRR